MQEGWWAGLELPGLVGPGRLVLVVVRGTPHEGVWQGVLEQLLGEDAWEQASGRTSPDCESSEGPPVQFWWGR